MRWYILTGEYPPAPGGVSDYTRQVAEALAARGEGVAVLAPAGRGGGRAQEGRGGVRVEWLPGRFGVAGLRALRAFLADEPPGGRLLVQYVPHAFGWRAMNVALCAFLSAQRRHALWVMFHEVAYPLDPGQGWRRDLLARVNRWMARRLAARAERVFLSTDAWRPLLRAICGREVPGENAPVPSNFEARTLDGSAVARPFTKEGQLVLGHFGTFSPWMARQLGTLFPAILVCCPEARCTLIGRGGEAFADQLAREHPALGARLLASGELSASAAPIWLAACDVLIQPYADGINTRRGSAMAALALARPVVTRAGHHTEPVWRGGAVCLVAGDDPGHWASAVRRLLDSPDERLALGQRGAALYREHFSLEHTLRLLLDEPGPDS